MMTGTSNQSTNFITEVINHIASLQVSEAAEALKEIRLAGIKLLECNQEQLIKEREAIGYKINQVANQLDSLRNNIEEELKTVNVDDNREIRRNYTSTIR